MRTRGWPLPAVVAHRCGGALAPENTLAGLDASAACGCRGVEFDVMLSADGTPFLIHDETLARTTDGHGAVAATVDAVLRRVRPALAGEQLAYADLEMDVAAHRVRRGGILVPLGPTEFRLLKHFLEHPGRVFSRERLLDAVWSHDPDIDARTVDVHVRRLRQALNAGDRPDLIRTVRSAGYSLDTER